MVQVQRALQVHTKGNLKIFPVNENSTTLNNKGYDKKNEPTMILPSRVHTRPKPKTTKKSLRLRLGSGLGLGEGRG